MVIIETGMFLLSFCPKGYGWGARHRLKDSTEQDDSGINIGVIPRGNGLSDTGVEWWVLRGPAD